MGVLYPSVTNGFERVSEARDGAADRALDRQNTGVVAANATYHPDNDTLVVTARNDGSTTLWLPGETARFEVGNVSTSPARAVVVVDGGVRDWVGVV